MKKQGLRAWMGWLRLVGVALLIGLIVLAGPGNLLRVFKEAQWGWLLLGFLLNIPQLGLKAFRWQRLVRWQGISLGYGQAFLSYFSALLVGFLTPGRLGEMARAFVLREEGKVTLSRAFSSVVADRVFDLYLLLTLGMIAFIRFALIGSMISRPLFAILCVALFAPLLLLNGRLVEWIVRRLERAGGGAGRRARWAGRLHEFTQGLAVLTPGRVLICIGLTGTAYAIFFLQCFCAAWALGISIRAIDLVLIMAATNLIGFLPVAPPSNLGTREASLVFFLGLVLPAAPVALAVSWGLAQFLILFVGGGLIGFICWQVAPIGLRQAVDDARHYRRSGAKIEADDQTER